MNYISVGKDLYDTLDAIRHKKGKKTIQHLLWYMVSKELEKKPVKALDYPGDINENETSQ